MREKKREKVGNKTPNLGKLHRKIEFSIKCLKQQQQPIKCLPYENANIVCTHTHTCLTLMCACVCANNKTFNIYFIRISVGILCIINLQAKLQQFSRSKKPKSKLKSEQKISK